jgi:elongation factor 1-alpha
MKWFDGPTLLAAPDLMKVPEKPVQLPLRIPVQDVYTITGAGTVPVGRVETGKLTKGDKVIFNPPALALVVNMLLGAIPRSPAT